MDGSMRRSLYGFGARCGKCLNVMVSRNDAVLDNKCEESVWRGRMKLEKRFESSHRFVAILRFHKC